MFGWGRRKALAAPLHDWVSERTTDWFEQFAEERLAVAEDGQKLLNTLVFGGVLTCASSAAATVGRKLPQWLGNVGLDAMTFELLAFAFYAVRESHLPTPDDAFDDCDPEELVESYRFAMGAIPTLISKQTGWDVDDLWQRRVMFYFQRNNMKDATEALVGILLTMTHANVPQREYGPLALDLAANVKLRLLVHTYASEVPKRMADALQELAVDNGLIL